MSGSRKFDFSEDPMATQVRFRENEQKQTLLSMTYVNKDVPKDEKPIVSTRFYLAPTVEQFSDEAHKEPIAEIVGVKDCHVVQRENGKLLLFVRFTQKTYPDGGPDVGDGRIGIAQLDSLEDFMSQGKVDEAVQRARNHILSLDVPDDGHGKVGSKYADVYKETLLDGTEKEYVHLYYHTASVDPKMQDGQPPVYDFDEGILHYKGYETVFDPDVLLDTEFPPDIVLPRRLVATPSSIDGKEHSTKDPKLDDVIFLYGPNGKGQLVIGYQDDEQAFIMHDPYGKYALSELFRRSKFVLAA